MKKLFLSFAVIATLAVASCGTSDKKAEDEGAALKAKIENCSDPDSLKIYVQQASEYANKLVEKGDDSAAKAYLEEITPAVTAKDPSVASLFQALKDKANGVVEAATDAAGAATDSVNAAVEGVKDAANDAVEGAKEAAAATVDNAKQAASDAVEKAKSDAKQKAADAVQAGADKLKNAISGEKK